MLCGKNAALDELTGKVDEIKGKLAEGMSALSDLESKANEALSSLTSLVPEIPSFDSLQGDLAAALAAAQGDAAAAFATFKSKWGDALPEAEIQGYIDTITAIASDPTALLTFDPCKAFPNKEIDSAGKVVVKAKAAEVPKAEDFQEITPYEPVITKTYESKITDEMTAATQARKDNMQKQADYFKAIKKAHKAKRQAIKDDPGFKSAKKKASAAGKKASILLAEGKLTEAEAKGVEAAKAWNKELERIKARDYLMNTQLLAYGFMVDGSLPADLYNKDAATPGSYLQGGKNGAIPQADLDKFAELSANLDAVATGLVQWKEYRDELAKD